MKKSETKEKQKAPVKTMSKEVKNIIKQLKKSEIDCFCVPEEYRNDKNIIDVERKLGIRKLGKRGYDIIRNTFFAEEELSDDIRTKKEITYFDDFESYSALWMMRYMMMLVIISVIFLKSRQTLISIDYMIKSFLWKIQ